MSKRQRDRKAKRVRHTRKTRTAVGAGLALGAALAAPAVGHANTFNVTSTADTNTTGTLRNAINLANATPDHDDITFASALSGQTITLTDTLPMIGYPVSIHGLGSGSLTVHQSTANKGVFQIYEQNAKGSPVDISGLTVSGGSYTNGNDGAGISAKYTTLNLDDVTVANNSTTGSGAGIAARFGATTLTDSTIYNNTTSGSSTKGGGIATSGSPSLSVTTSLTITHSAIRDNHATGTSGSGAGIATYDTQLSIDSSTINNNTAEKNGGGIASQDLKNTDAIANTTISNNGVNTGAGAGIYSLTYSGDTVRPFTIDSSTISNNGAETGGGGIAAFGSGSGSNAPGGALNNTIVGKNNSTTGQADIVKSGAVDPFAASFSLVQAAPPAGTLTETVTGSNILGQDPLLGNLTTNGGTTATRAPLVGSPVIDKGKTAHNCDQRGFNRPVDNGSVPNSTAAGADGSDIGAVEVGGSPASSCGLKPPPAPPAPPPPVVPSIPAPTFGKLSTSSVKVGSNSVSIVLSCASANCDGVLNLLTTEKLKGSKVVGLAKKKRKKSLKVGSKAYALTAGQTKRITVKLNSKGKSLLKKFGKEPVKLAVTQKQLNGKSVTIKTAKATIKARKKKH